MTPAILTSFIRVPASVLALTVGLSAARATEADAQSLRGVWLVQVQQLTSCSGGTPLPAFWSTLTFADGGTLTGSTLNQAFAPGQRGPDQGGWAPAPGGGFTASSLAFIQFTTAPSPPTSPGFQAGAQLIDQHITMADDGTFTSDAVVTFFDLGASPYRQGCAVATGRRFR